MATDRGEELFRALKSKGFPDDFCKELTYRQLNTDYTATRMLGYLYRQSEPRIGDDVWEALEPLEKKLADAGVQWAVWTIADIFNGLMAIPNLIALLALNGVVVAETKIYLDGLKNNGVE